MLCHMTLHQTTQRILNHHSRIINSLEGATRCGNTHLSSVDVKHHSLAILLLALHLDPRAIKVVGAESSWFRAGMRSTPSQRHSFSQCPTNTTAFVSLYPMRSYPYFPDAAFLCCPTLLCTSLSLGYLCSLRLFCLVPYSSWPRESAACHP